MNKKVVILGLSLLTISIAVAPAMAEPTNGQKVPAELYGTLKPVAGESWTTDGNITQRRALHLE